MIYLIHGLNGCADEWNDFVNFFTQKGFKCSAVELRDGMNLRKTRFQDYVDKIVNRVNSNDIVIGHSMGGLIVQKVAEQAQIKAGVCLCSAPPKGIQINALSLMSQLRYIPFIIARIPFLPSFSLMHNHFLNGIPLKEAQKRYKKLQKQSAIVSYEVLKNKISVDEQKVTCPLLFIARENDIVISPDIVKRTAEKYHAPMKTFPGNHYIFTEYEMLSKEIYHFIKNLNDDEQ